MAEMISLDRPWTLSAAADAGRNWLAALLARQRTRLNGHQHQLDGSEESALCLERRILAARTDIAAINRSLAMQKHALDGAWPGPASTPTDTAPGKRPAAPPPPHHQPDDNPTAYADTEPMPFLDSADPSADRRD